MHFQAAKHKIKQENLEKLKLSLINFQGKIKHFMRK